MLRRQTRRQEPSDGGAGHYLAGLCDYSDKLSPGGREVVLLLAPDMKQAKVLLDYAEGRLESAPLLKQLLASRTAETKCLFVRLSACPSENQLT